MLSNNTFTHRNTDIYNHDRMIITSTGIIPMNSITPGMKVYDYTNGEKIEIIDVEDILTDEYIEIKMKDGRVQRMTIDEYAILTKFNIIQFHGARFNINYVSYYKAKIGDIGYDFDSYTLGFLMGTQREGDVYIAIPNEVRYAFTSCLYKYHLAYGLNIGDDRVLLEDEYLKTNLKWCERFNIYGVDKNRYNMIPIEIQLGSFKERRDFIRGIMDSCTETIDGYPAFTHPNTEFMIAIQRIVWSVNCQSYIYIGTIGEYKDKQFLCINEWNVPGGFYYNEDYVMNFLRDYQRKNLLCNANDSVTYEHASIVRLDYNVNMRIPKFDNEDSLYVDANFLPMPMLSI